MPTFWQLWCIGDPFDVRWVIIPYDHKKPSRQMNYLRTRPYRGTLTPLSGLFENFLGNLGEANWLNDMPDSLPRVNISEKEEGFQLELLAPGFRKEDLKLNMEKDMLTISAEQEQQEDAEDEHYTRREFSKRSFSRSFRLPEQVDADGIKAEHINGVLTVSLPKKRDVKPAVKQISIG